MRSAAGEWRHGDRPGTIGRVAWQVRSAESRDVEAVRAVAAAAWRDTYAGLLRPETIEAFIANAYSAESVRRRISHRVFLVAESEAGIGAFADSVEEPDRITLAAIYAHPAVRGQGAGTALLDGIRERLAALPIAADVLVGNRKGERFYERRGFTPREIVEEQLFGESVLERRWWQEPPPRDRGE